MSLPNRILTWAWRPALCNPNPSNLYLPATVSEQDPAIAHYSNMTLGGGEHSWFWLFGDPEEAYRLRMLQKFGRILDAGVVALLESALPYPAPGEMDGCRLAWIPPDWLAQQITQISIQEVWVGFDFQAFVRDRSLRASAGDVYSPEDFCRLFK